ncbi:TadE/TadG family type IV pilus assembly protein [Erwinia sp. V71]|uniref:TadE/TadG family type IV pilus assembly protein n=1 Tax=Erwinia sp. V71 TaxID=3369424 RepID=UPI003F6479B3
MNKRLTLLRHALRRFWRQERGAGTAFYVLGMMGLLLTGAYIIDTVQTTGDAAQVKRATDAAALAVGREALSKNNSDYTAAERQQLAWQYVRSNLGMNSELVQQLDAADVTVTEGRSSNARRTYTVTVSFASKPMLLAVEGQQHEIYSTAEVIYRPSEVALVLPNTSSETNAELAVLRRLGNNFATDFLADYPDRRLALVPYSQSVSVYDADRWSDRIRSWAMNQALTPVELTSLFRNNDYGIANLASRQMPDLRSRRMCLYRGLDQGENYFWDEAPANSFWIHYRHDLPINATWMPFIEWVGPNPDFGQATGVNDTRYIVGDKGCPTAALLPLTDDLNKISTRLDQMESQFNVNYAIAMGWAAMSLSPAFRGDDGWGDSEYPLDFNDNGSGNIKAIVMMANTIGDWFDTDAYNAYVGEAIDGDGQQGTDGAIEAATRRFESLCESFRNHDVLFYFIGVRPGDPEDFGRTLFGQVAVPGLQVCATNDGGYIKFADSSSFAGAEGQISNLLDGILDDIDKHSSSVRLIE